MRYVCPAAASLLSFVLLAPVFPAMAQGGSPTLAVDGNYTYVSQARASLTQSYITYHAELVNNGPALASVTARVTSLASGIKTVPGQDTVHFGPVPANAHATSIDTFTLLVNRTVTFSGSDLQWTVQGPVANAGPPQTVAAGSTVLLNGGGSTNNGSGTLSYLWSFSSIPAGSSASLSNATSITPTFVADQPGQYVISLTVNNGTASDTATTTISTTYSAPVAIAGPNQTVPVGTTVTLDGSNSYDVDGNPLTYSWSFITIPTNSYANLGSGYASPTPTFTADVAGTYVLRLTVSDENGSSTPSTVSITTGNTPAVANAGPNQVVTTGTTVQLNGTGSTDVNGNHLSYRWALIALPSGSAATLSDPSAPNPTFVADQNGTYVAQLIVNDGTIDSAPSTVVVTTNAILAPVANAGPDQYVPVNTLVTLSGSGSDPQSLAFTYRWALISKPMGSVSTLQGAGANPTFYVDYPGTYVFQLITNNGYLNSTPSTVVVTTGTAAPIAVPTGPQNVATGTLVNLDGSTSYDPSHNGLTYSWSLVHVPQGSVATLQNATTATPSFLADVSGVFVAQLIVNNGTRNSVPMTVAVTASTMKVTLSPNPLNLQTNAPGTLTVSVTPPAGPSGLTVNLSGFDPTVISVPASVSIPANSGSATVTVTPLRAGVTSIFATAIGYTAGTAAVNVGMPSLSVSLPAGVGIGHSVTGTVTLSSAAPASGTVVNLSFSPN
jgi:hypothetical protein